MTDTDRPRATFQDMTSREKAALLFQTVVLFGTVPDLAVALLRFARRERGIQLGPTLATVALATVTPRLARRSLTLEGRPGGAVRVGLLAAVPLLPAAAGTVRATVVGTRHPLWQLAVSAVVRVMSGCLTVLPAAFAVSRRRRAAELTAA